MSYILDTCMLSESVKPRMNLGVQQWLENIDDHHLFFSVISLGEIQKGIAHLSDQHKKNSYSQWLDGVLIPKFANRILSVDMKIAKIWGDYLGNGLRKKVRIPEADALIAATAHAFKFSVVTRNVSDFEIFGVNVANPWT